MGCVCCKECCQGGTYDVAGRRIRRQDGEEGEWRVRGQHVLRYAKTKLQLSLCICSLGCLLKY